MRTTQPPGLLSTLEHAALGAVARLYPPKLVDQALDKWDREEERRRALPARLMVYFVIAMALFSDAAYREVLQNLVESLRGLRAWADHWQVPTRTGIWRGNGRVSSRCANRSRRWCSPLVRRRRAGRGIAANAWWRWTARHLMRPTVKRTRPSLGGQAVAAESRAASPKSGWSPWWSAGPTSTSIMRLEPIQKPSLCSAPFAANLAIQETGTRGERACGVSG